MSNRSLKCSVRKRFTGSTADGVESVMYCLWLTLLLNFFFPSRRRHTRGNCDWSSDVCSSDLLGVPFSDPLADGPTIQAAAERAIRSGTTLAGILDLVDRVRRGGCDVPLALMGYMNPIVRMRSEERRVGKECRSGGGV